MEFMQLPCGVNCSKPPTCVGLLRCDVSGELVIVVDGDPRWGEATGDVMSKKPEPLELTRENPMSSSIRVSQTGRWHWEAYASFGTHREAFIHAYTEKGAWKKARRWVARRKFQAERIRRTTKEERDDG